MATATGAIGQVSRSRGDTLVSVRLVVNPATDTGFAAFAQKLSESVDTPEELERLLQDRYSGARVVRGVTDIVERWYVYRDGHWVNTSAD